MTGPMVRGVRVAFVAAIVSLSSFAPAVLAQTVGDAASADALFEHAKELLRGGDWASGCAKFRASMELDPSVATLLKIAKCDEHEGKLALALHDCNAALALNRHKTDVPSSRRAELERFASRMLAELEPRVPKLRIRITPMPAGLSVRRAGQELLPGALGDALPADPGAIEVTATAPGYRSESRTAQLTEGETTDVDIVLQPIEAPAPASTQPAATSSPAPSRPHTRPTQPAVSANPPGRTIGFALGGLGLAGLATAGVLGWMTVSEVRDATPYCDKSWRCQEPGLEKLRAAGGYQTASFVTAGVATALLGVGVYLVLASPSRHAPSVSATVTPAGAVVGGLF